MDDIAKEAAKRVLLVDLSAEVEDPSLTESFKSRVVARVRSDPLYCSTPACMNNTNLPMGSFARHLHDAFFMYGAALRRADTAQLDGRQSANVMTRAMEGSFEGLTGKVTINSNGTRLPLYMVYALDTNAKQRVYANISFIDEDTVILTKLYTNEATSIWATRGGKRPLARPVCGYTGFECPLSFWQQYLIYIIIGAFLVFIVLLALLCLAVANIR
ncbi:hypothetical protein ANCCEY_14113 [Ancylostoma ceylanicum]|uniref:Receptor ligand binding region domain-containing protein n=1 Tax=Ancylostoma ceylanicum TaxID=53326 RepID=A0A0D6LGP3_9BILA|nr:hypothetical protein ANCCEY_14113 [Ancylostoma ceylanicum]